jgi:predicted RND superfamily exporter protein
MADPVKPGSEPASRDDFAWGGRAAWQFAAFVNRFAVPVAIALAAVTALAVFGVTRLAFEDNLRNMFRANTENMEELEALYRQFSNDDNTAFVVLEADDMFAADAVAALRELESRLQQVEQVTSTWSMNDLVVFPAARG